MVHSHTEPHFFPAWIKVLGFDWIWEDERFKGAPHRFPDEECQGGARPARLGSDEGEDLRRMDGGVPPERQRLRRRHPEHAGSAAPSPDGRDRQPAPSSTIPAWVRSSRSDRWRRSPAHPLPSGVRLRLPGQDSAALRLPSRARPATVAAPERARALRGPLDGVTIVECAYYYATPFATALLADLGARVIKIERLQGDPYRLLGGDPYGMSDGGSDPVLNLGHNNMVRAMQGKESIALNLKDERGRKILHRLVAKADVFVHSFRPGVPESLGIDYETMRRVNPDLVYQYGASYGSTGPYSRQPAIDPIIAAFAGTTVHQAGEGNPPLTETGCRPRGCGRARHGDGPGSVRPPPHRPGPVRRVLHDRLEHLPQLRRRTFLRGQAAAAGGRPRAARYGADPQALRDRGPARGERAGAVREPGSPLGVPLGRERRRSSVPSARWPDGPSWRPTSGSPPRPHGIATPRPCRRLLEEVFRTRPAAQWEASLLAAGVGCVTADAMSHFAFLFRDPQALANGTMVETEHPSFGGRYWRHAPMLQVLRDAGRGTTPLRARGAHPGDPAGTGVRPVGDDRPAARRRRRVAGGALGDAVGGIVREVRRVASPAAVGCTRSRGGGRRWRGTSRARSRS